jgi:tetratricopeptide (TPR) repeat protein
MYGAPYDWPMPVWKPSRRSRLVKTVKGAWHQISDFIQSAWQIAGSFARVLTIALLICVVCYGVRELTRNTIVIEPIGVPKNFADAGITQDVMANRIKDRLEVIENELKLPLWKDRVGMRADDASRPDIEVPGTKLGLKFMIEMIRTLLPSIARPKNVGGEIIYESASANHPEPSPKDQIQRKVSLTIRIKSEPDASRTVVFSFSRLASDIDGLASDAAEAVLQNANPYPLAVYFYDHGHKDHARTIAESIVSDHSQDRLHQVRAYNLLGLIRDDEGKFEESTSNYEAAKTLLPKFAPTYSNWARLFIHQQNYPKAITMYQKATELDPKLARAYYNWGVVLLNQGALDEAINKFQTAIHFDPKLVQAYINLARAQLLRERYNDAGETCQRAVKEVEPDQNLAAVYINWGNALAKLNQPSAASTKFENAIEIDPKSWVAYIRLGDSLDEMHKPDEAIIKYRKAVELNPKSIDAYMNWGTTVDHQCKYTEAVAKYEKVIELDPQNALAYNNLGQVLDHQNKHDAEIEKYERAVKINPNYTEAVSNWGDALRKLHRYNEAIVKYKEAIKIKSDYINAYIGWGTTLSHQLKYDEAIATFEEAIKLNPKSALAYNDLGEVLARQTKYSDAVTKFEKAIELDSNDALAYTHLAITLKKMGSFSEAQEKFDQARKLRKIACEAEPTCPCRL